MTTSVKKYMITSDFLIRLVSFYSVNASDSIVTYDNRVLL